MSALYDCQTCGAPTEGNAPDEDDGNRIVHIITTKNRKTGEIRRYEFDDGKPGEKELNMENLNGGAGVPFRSEDEAAFAWALENTQFTERGSKEHAGTIYSQVSGKSSRSFSYIWPGRARARARGSFCGRAEDRSVSHENEDNSRGKKVEGFIHTHDIYNNFSFNDRKAVGRSYCHL